MEARTIDVALQGGGAHGAFTWGVLHRLLDEPDIAITGVSGTSAGAMNGVALVQGLSEGSPARAQDLMAVFWERVAKAAAFSPVQRTPIDRMLQGWRLDRSPLYEWADAIGQFFSPYYANPLDINPLRQILRETFDFELINKKGAPKFFQSATNVRTGRLKLFRQPEITIETTLASACLPTVYQAVEIDGEAFWDGGYMGNPPLFPLIDETPTLDTILVQINPFIRKTLPRSRNDIENRLNEIIFNGSLINELRSLGFLHQLIESEDLDRDAYRNGRLHRIANEDEMQSLNLSTKMNASPDFLDYLFNVGVKSAETWLSDHGDKIGKKSTWIPRYVVEESRSPAHLADG
ncbi:MAG: patatin-like phospholipase family protein [Pseudomonadota bacterium]